jgi:hypothetical protein
MPESSVAGEINSGKICKPEQLRWERRPKKGTGVSLPLRTGRDTKQHLESTKRPRISHFRHAISASAKEKVRRPQDHGRLHLLNNSPFVLLGSGGRDPFSTLPSDLPQAFLDEHLQTSKCPEISIHVSRTTHSFYVGDWHWIC